MIWAYLFTVLALLNYRDSVKFNTALSFALVHWISYGANFDGVAFYFSAIGACIALLLYPLMASQRNWVLALSGILLLCTSVNLLGIVNFELWHSQKIGDVIDFSNYLTTALEMVVLACMANGQLNGYYPDTLGRIRQYPVWDIFTGFNLKIHLPKAVQK